MKEVLRLLQAKNRCLKRFLDISAEFLVAAEASDFSALESFHKRRDTILRAVNIYDDKVSAFLESMETRENNKTPELSDLIRKALDEKNLLISEITVTDQKILDLIQKEKNRIRKELGQTQKDKDMLGKFRSDRSSVLGEGFDEIL